MLGELRPVQVNKFNHERVEWKGHFHKFFDKITTGANYGTQSNPYGIIELEDGQLITVWIGDFIFTDRK